MGVVAWGDWSLNKSGRFSRFDCTQKQKYSKEFCYVEEIYAVKILAAVNRDNVFIFHNVQVYNFKNNQ